MPDRAARPEKGVTLPPQTEKEQSEPPEVARHASTSGSGVVSKCLLLLLILSVPFVASASAIAGGARTPSPDALGAESVIADLQAYVPERMDSGGVPGLAIALVERGQIAWEAGFGVANTLTRAPVNEDSVFEVGSLSKPVAAYAALKLVDAGSLRLDDPLYTYFDRPWLPRSDESDRITARMLLSHTAGFSKRLHPLDKSLHYEPGQRFAYSNVGYQYLQAAIERISGLPLEQVADEAVFEPLGMKSSTFAERPDLEGRLVSGHINYGTDLAPVVAVVALSFAVVFGLGLAAQRLSKGRVALTWERLAVFYLIAAGAAVPVVVWLNGGWNKWSLYFVLMMGVMSLWLGIWVFASRKIYRRISSKWGSPRWKIVFELTSVVVGVVAFAVLANAFSGPVPRGPSPAPGAAYSLRSTAGDLTRFMIELAEPRHLDPGTAGEVTRPQVRTSSTNSWGLGIAIYHAADGDWLWHAGDNADFHALMVMQPSTGRGVVVLANGQAAPPVVVDVARRAMGVDFTWSSR